MVSLSIIYGAIPTMLVCSRMCKKFHDITGEGLYDAIVLKARPLALDRWIEPEYILTIEPAREIRLPPRRSITMVLSDLFLRRTKRTNISKTYVNRGSHIVRSIRLKPKVNGQEAMGGE